MRQFKVEGIVIKRRNIGEADKLLTVYTKDFGKLNIRALGVRKITSHRSSHLELINHVILGLYKNNHLPILTEVTTVQQFASIKTNLSRVALAYHICELIDSLCPESQENRQIFFLLQKILADLSSKEEIGAAIHQFEMDLLITLGYISQAEILSGAKASYFIEEILERKLKARQILPALLS